VVSPDDGGWVQMQDGSPRERSREKTPVMIWVPVRSKISSQTVPGSGLQYVKAFRSTGSLLAHCIAILLED